MVAMSFVFLITVVAIAPSSLPLALLQWYVQYASLHKTRDPRHKHSSNFSLTAYRMVCKRVLQLHCTALYDKMAQMTRRLRLDC